MLVDTRDTLLSPWLLLDGLWETTVSGWLAQTLQPGQVFVDVGANVGYFTLLGGQLVGRSGQVIAVEAHPFLATLLRRNVVLNSMHDYISTWNRAGWSETTRLKFHLRARFSANSSAGSVSAEHLAYLHDEEQVVEVDAVTMDELLSDVEKVDVIKVDVEGAEVQVLLGLEQTLARNPAITLMFEWSPSQLEAVGNSPSALLDILTGHGFEFCLIEDDLRPIDRHRLLQLPYGNVVASR
jgi:FkbM family methyltransferase